MKIVGWLKPPSPETSILLSIERVAALSMRAGVFHSGNG
jgi:hypothetical protein